MFNKSLDKHIWQNTFKILEVERIAFGGAVGEKGDNDWEEGLWWGDF